jgi:hypothetical protein
VAPIQATDTGRAIGSPFGDVSQDEGAQNLAVVLGDGSRDSGGRHDHVVSNTLVPTLRQIGRELRNQYALTYYLPSGVDPSDRLSVSVTRGGLKVHAPSRIPR